MKMMLAENIRTFRKERSLTQEQLAEALGVTAGAVYKWEAKLSIPELGLIIQMADFFDISVDVLLGYEVRDNRLETTVKRLQEYRRSKDLYRSCRKEMRIKETTPPSQYGSEAF
jgi:transcriptional regulator with XRE-family HTH domain